MSSIENKLNELLDEYAVHAPNIRAELNAGLASEYIFEKTKWFPYELPSEILALYKWRDGQNLDTKTPFTFRDLQFVEIEKAQKNYESLISAYGQYDDCGIEVEKCFPFAECMGALLTICCDGKFKIVNLFEGVEVYFVSFESMLNTCIDWVSQKKFKFFNDIPNEEKIWSKHNPSIFDTVLAGEEIDRDFAELDLLEQDLELSGLNNIKGQKYGVEIEVYASEQSIFVPAGYKPKQAARFIVILTHMSPYKMVSLTFNHPDALNKYLLQKTGEHASDRIYPFYVVDFGYGDAVEYKVEQDCQLRKIKN